MLVKYVTRFSSRLETLATDNLQKRRLRQTLFLPLKFRSDLMTWIRPIVVYVIVTIEKYVKLTRTNFISHIAELTLESIFSLNDWILCGAVWLRMLISLHYLHTGYSVEQSDCVCWLHLIIFMHAAIAADWFIYIFNFSIILLNLYLL